MVAGDVSVVLDSIWWWKQQPWINWSWPIGSYPELVLTISWTVRFSPFSWSIWPLMRATSGLRPLGESGDYVFVPRLDGVKCSCRRHAWIGDTSGMIGGPGWRNFRAAVTTGWGLALNPPPTAREHRPGLKTSFGYNWSVGATGIWWDKPGMLHNILQCAEVSPLQQHVIKLNRTVVSKVKRPSFGRTHPWCPSHCRLRVFA